MNQHNFCMYCGTQLNNRGKCSRCDVDEMATVTTDFTTTEEFHGRSGDLEPLEGQLSIPKKEFAAWKIVLIVVGSIVGLLVAGIIAITVFSMRGSRNFVHYGSPSTSALLGVWENGRGSIPLLTFESADVIEFRSDGTILFTEGSSSQVVNWETGADGTFRVDLFVFSYSIDGNYLIIIDSWNDAWRFDRAE